MAKRRRSKGLAPIELLFLIVALALLVGVLVLLFPRRRSYATRMVCGSNLSRIGKAVMLYANDYAGELPRAGGRSSTWGQVMDWTASDRDRAFGLKADGTGGAATVSSCFYLLVKYAEVPPKTFLCPSGRPREKGVTEFKLSTYRLRDKKLTLADLWDFGPNPAKHCSYAYQMVYSAHTLILSPEPNMAIGADRNPWMDAPAAKAGDFSLFTPEIPPFNGTSDQARQGNTSRHKGDGQNVLFLDTHVSFEKRPYCGFENDNIYTSWDGKDRVRGKPPKLDSQPAGEKDSLLVNDPPAARK
jgi:hypothetical protein